MTEGEKIRIIVAEDHRLMRQGLRHILERAPDFEIIGEAENGNQAIEMAGSLRPEVILCDIRMPMINGIVVTREVKRKLPGTKIIALSAYDDDEYVLELMWAGASGYLLKDIDEAELIESVRKVFAGETVLHPEIAAKIARLWAGASKRKANEKPLTPRETEVLSLAAEGLKNREIAEKLNLSTRTVERHLDNISNKLSVSSRTEAVHYGLKKRIIESL